MEVLVGGAIESNRECDYEVAGGLDIVPTPLFRFEDKKVQYNQAISDPYGCTWYAVATAIANNWGVVWTTDDWYWFRENAHRYGRKPKLGMLLSKAGDMVVDRLNDLYPEQAWKKQAISLYIDGDEYMKMGYMLMVGSIVNTKYFSFTKTGLISDTWGKDGEGHARTLFYHTAYPARGEVENYIGTLDHNIIDISTDIWPDVVEEAQYYRQAFIYYPTGQMPSDIPVEYNHGSTPYQQEVVHARESIIHDGRMPLFVVYTEDDYLFNMKIDIGIYRAKLRGDI